MERENQGEKRKGENVAFNLKKKKKKNDNRGGHVLYFLNKKKTIQVVFSRRSANT